LDIYDVQGIVNKRARVKSRSFVFRPKTTD